MPVSQSAKKALRVSARRKAENISIKQSYKGAIKTVKKAVAAGSEEVKSLLSEAQSALSKAAKSKTIHPNKAARLQSRMTKMANVSVSTTAESGSKKTTKKSTASKTTKTTKKKTTSKKK